MSSPVLIGGNFLLVLGGLFLALFVGYVMKDPEAEVANGSSAPGLGRPSPR